MKEFASRGNKPKREKERERAEWGERQKE